MLEKTRNNYQTFCLFTGAGFLLLWPGLVLLRFAPAGSSRFLSLLGLFLCFCGMLLVVCNIALFFNEFAKRHKKKENNTCLSHKYFTLLSTAGILTVLALIAPHFHIISGRIFLIPAMINFIVWVLLLFPWDEKGETYYYMIVTQETSYILLSLSFLAFTLVEIV